MNMNMNMNMPTPAMLTNTVLRVSISARASGLKFMPLRLSPLTFAGLNRRFIRARALLYDRLLTPVVVLPLHSLINASIDGWVLSGFSTFNRE